MLSTIIYSLLVILIVEWKITNIDGLLIDSRHVPCQQVFRCFSRGCAGCGNGSRRLLPLSAAHGKLELIWFIMMPYSRYHLNAQVNNNNFNFNNLLFMVLFLIVKPLLTCCFVVLSLCQCFVTCFVRVWKINSFLSTLYFCMKII
jgi:hypothetical protein